MYNGADNNDTIPPEVNEGELITKTQVAPVPTSPSIPKVPLAVIVSIRAHPAVPVSNAVPVYPDVLAKADVPAVGEVPEVAAVHPIPVIVQSRVPEVPASALAG